jgi:hypothetical protein
MNIFKKGDVIVSEDRKFRVILKVNENDYEFMHLSNNSFPATIIGKGFPYQDIIKMEIGDVGSQPQSIVEKHFHYFELK